MTRPPLDVQILVLANGAGLEMPSYQTAGSAGCDVRAAEPRVIPVGGWEAVPCGFAMALPHGWEAQVRPRSGLAARYGVTVLNAPGTIDADYRGEVKVLLINHGSQPFDVQRGDRVAQLVVAPVTTVAWRPVAELPGTDRGDGGFGSTGR